MCLIGDKLLSHTPRHSSVNTSGSLFPVHSLFHYAASNRVALCHLYWHIRTSKAIVAAQALRLLGISIRGMHQMHARQLHTRAILPVAAFGLPIFWKSKKGRTLNLLTIMQNKCLRMITGAFRTRNVGAMKIEASIPLIDLWMETWRG